MEEIYTKAFMREYNRTTLQVDGFGGAGFRVFDSLVFMEKRILELTDEGIEKNKNFKSDLIN